MEMKNCEADKGDVALLAWKIVANLTLLAIVAGTVSMIPELVRYFKLKNM